MRELNGNEIAAVSGAGKIQDTTTSVFGTIFSNIYKLIPLADMGYSAEEVTSAGETFGSRVGSLIETQVNKLLGSITSALNSIVS